MTRRVVVLSGRIASGKSTLAANLVDMFDAELISTRSLLGQIATARGIDASSREEFQAFGTALDRETEGRWIVDAIRPILGSLPADKVVVIDAVRLSEQLTALRNSFGRTIVHVHLTAFGRDLEKRFAIRSGSIDKGIGYRLAATDLTERQVETLAPIADLQVNTSVTDVRDVLVLCASRIGLLPPIENQLVDVMVGGEYGSEGKGNLAYYLAPEYDVLVRAGGPNAGHQVPTSPVVTHRTLPSGSLANLKAQIYIAAGSVVSPDVLREEIRVTGVDPSRIHIDPQAMVISAADIKKEVKLKTAIGSTGQGVGEAMVRRIAGRKDKSFTLAASDTYLKQFVSAPITEKLETAFSREQRVFLEGTQGAALSLFHGHYPFVTSRDTTAAACLSEAGIGIKRVRKIIMVIRSYPIRVQGNSGPMGNEITWRTVALRSGISQEDLEAAEMSSVQHKLRRVAEFDWKLLRASTQLNTPTDIALTFADYLQVSNRDAFRFEQLDSVTRELIEDIESVTSAPVSLIAGRFTNRSVIDRRRWRGHVSHESGEQEESSNG